MLFSFPYKNSSSFPHQQRDFALNIARGEGNEHDGVKWIMENYKLYLSGNHTAGVFAFPTPYLSLVCES